MTELVSLMTPASEESRKELERKKGDRYTYLVLLEGEYLTNEGENYKSFEIIKGRQAAYDFIKELLESQRDEGFGECIIDVDKSRVLSEPPASEINEKTPRLTLSNMLSIYGFMKAMKEKGKIVDDTSFDIEDYYDGYIPTGLEDDE